MLGVLGDGDTLVARLDRLGRSLRDLANVAHEIEEAGAYLRVIGQSVDTSTAVGRAFFSMLAVFAVFETDVRRERQMEDIAMAKRQAGLDRARVKQLTKDGLGPPRSRASSAWPAARSTDYSEKPATNLPGAQYAWRQ